jgi:hypothetical protein
MNKKQELTNIEQGILSIEIKDIEFHFEIQYSLFNIRYLFVNNNKIN